MELEPLQQKARTLLDLHQGPRILVLPNAWDAASARIFEQAGFPALATTSAGVAYTLGYADGEQISRDEMLDAVRRIAWAVEVPVTADMEAGYGPRPEDAAATARAVLEVGAVGMNLEDSKGLGLVDAVVQVEKIEAIRAAAEAAGVHLVLNARTDVFLRQVGDPARRLSETVRRANAYRAAGADSLFVPGVSDAHTIGELVHNIQGPLNILAGRGTPSIGELERLGVRRVSVGSGIMRATLKHAQRIAVELREQGTYASFTENTIASSEAQRLFKRSE